MFIIQLFVFLLGVIIGSFLNVVALRYNSGVSIKGRSFCMSCGKKLFWYELIPVFSFLFQKGKCNQCKAKISFQYPIVEIITGALFLLIFNYQFSIFNIIIPGGVMAPSIINYPLISHIIYFWTIFSILIVIAIYDIRHKIIPDGLVFLFAGMSFLGLLAGFGPEINKINLFAGIILATPFALLWLISKGKWIGLGDAKMALGIGWFLGLLDGISAIILSFWIGAFFGVFLILFSKIKIFFFKHKNFTIKSEIPFAPFMILGMLLTFFFKWDILGLKQFLI